MTNVMECLVNMITTKVRNEYPDRLPTIKEIDEQAAICREICKSLDHRVLIPVNSPDLEVTYEDDNSIEFTVLNCLEYKLPQQDVVLLPITATTAESLSVYITESIVEKIDNKEFLNYIEVQVNEGIGQGASYRYYFNE